MKFSIRADGADPLLIYCILNATISGAMTSGMMVVARSGSATPVNTFPFRSAMLPFSIVINVLVSFIPTLPSALTLFMSSSESVIVKTLLLTEVLPFCNVYTSVESSAPCTDI